MKKEVLIAIKGMQVEYAQDVEEQGNEPIEIINPATYFFKNGQHYVFFEEMQEGSADVVQNKIVFRENEALEVIKKGMTHSEMIFHKGEQHTTKYETPLGEMLLGITTHNITSIIEETAIQIEVDYDLDVNDDPFARCQITMRISNQDLGIAL